MKRKLPTYAAIPLGVLFSKKLSPTDKLVYGALASFTRKGHMLVWPGNATLCDLTGLGERTVQRSILKLAKRGHLKVTIRGKKREVLLTGAGTWAATDVEADPVTGDARHGCRPSPVTPVMGDALPRHQCRAYPVTGDDRRNTIEETQRSNSPKAPKPGAAKKSKKSKPKKPAEHEKFPEFWGLVPRKIAKGAARKAFSRAMAGVSWDLLRAATVRWAAAMQPRLDAGEANFVPHPATWLNQERWEDEAEPAPKAKITNVPSDWRADQDRLRAEQAAPKGFQPESKAQAEATRRWEGYKRRSGRAATERTAGNADDRALSRKQMQSRASQGPRGGGASSVGEIVNGLLPF